MERCQYRDFDWILHLYEKLGETWWDADHYPQFFNSPPKCTSNYLNCEILRKFSKQCNCFNMLMPYSTL